MPPHSTHARTHAPLAQVLAAAPHCGVSVADQQQPSAALLETVTARGARYAGEPAPPAGASEGAPMAESASEAGLAEEPPNASHAATVSVPAAVTETLAEEPPLTARFVPGRKDGNQGKERRVRNVARRMCGFRSVHENSEIAQTWEDAERKRNPSQGKTQNQAGARARARVPTLQASAALHAGVAVVLQQRLLAPTGAETTTA